MTRPFQKPASLVAPPAPAWIVRRPPVNLASDPDAIEIVYVGHMLREELDRNVERLARWPWPFGADDKDAAVVELVDIHGAPIGVRLQGDSLTLSHVTAIVCDLFDASITCQAHSPRPSGAMHRKG